MFKGTYIFLITVNIQMSHMYGQISFELCCRYLGT